MSKHKEGNVNGTEELQNIICTSFQTDGYDLSLFMIDTHCPSAKNFKTNSGQSTFIRKSILPTIGCSLKSDEKSNNEWVKNADIIGCDGGVRFGAFACNHYNFQNGKETGKLPFNCFLWNPSI